MVSRVLLATDNIEAKNRLRHALEAEDLTVLTAESAEDVLALLDSHDWDLMLIQTNLPGLRACELAQICSRRTGAVVLVVDLTATEAVKSRRGSDDMMNTDADAPEDMVSRVGALRMIDVQSDESGLTTQRQTNHCVTSGDLTLWLEQHAVTIGERLIPLKPVEALILRVLLEHSPRVVPPELLLARVWPDSGGDLSVLAAGINSLRHALDDDPLNPSRIRHAEGYGYKITPQRE